MRKKYDKLTNKKLMTITFGVEQISKPTRWGLSTGHITIIDVRFKDIQAIYKTLYRPKLELGYSMLFEYKGKRKILLYN